MNRLRYYWIRLKGLFADVSSAKDFFLALARIFNYANLRIKRATGFFLPFSFGVPPDELKDPVGIHILNSLERRLEPVVVTGINAPPHLNVMIPTISPQLIFGGYIGLFNFLKSLLDRGHQVRLMICEDVIPLTENITKKLGNESVVSEVLARCELRECLDRDVVQEVGKDDVFIGYSWLTMRLAYHASRMLNRRRPIYFIQEYEPIFHHYDSLRFLADETYTFPHKAVFNSPQLASYFKDKKIGVFSDEWTGGYVSFRHAIADTSPPSLSELKARETKSVLVYARPEKHAGRNMFEVSMLAIKEAIKEGVFAGDDWEFYGIGSLGAKDELDLGKGYSLKLVPRMSYKDYVASLRIYDVGISLMYAPHPSVPPFEMASSGQLAITTCFENRSPESMEEISGNIISARHTIASLVQSIRSAVSRVEDYECRLRFSKIDWPRSWDESFDEEFFKKFERLLES